MKTKLTLLSLLAFVVPAFAVNYNGLLTTDAASTAPAETSLLSITDSSTTAISGKVGFAATSYPFTAVLDAAGHANVSISRTGKPTPPPLLLSLQADAARGFIATTASGTVKASGVAARPARSSADQSSAPASGQEPRAEFLSGVEPASPAWGPMRRERFEVLPHEIGLRMIIARRALADCRRALAGGFRAGQSLPQGVFRKSRVRAKGPYPYQPGASPQVCTRDGTRAESPDHRRRYRERMCRAFSRWCDCSRFLGRCSRLAWVAPLAHRPPQTFDTPSQCGGNDSI